MKKIILFLAVSVLLISGCSKRDTPPSDTTVSDTPSIQTEAPDTQPVTETAPESETILETAEETVPETVTVSRLATPDYLLPYDKYSWEREYPAEFVVLHFTSDVVNSKNDPYSIEAVKKIFESTEVSSHYIIDREGSIKCFIPEDRAAWHAGVGTFADNEKYTNKMNKYSIGIEMLAIGSYNDMQYYLTPAEYNSLDSSLIGFTEEQYTSLKELLTDICQRNGIPYDRQHIIGHDEYNPKKNDPGELFDWDRLFD